jgi:thiol:disulfide interchange protein DsbD
MRNLRILYFVAAVLTSAAAHTGYAQNLPSADQVFQMSVAKDAVGSIVLNWSIASGTYLYRDKIEVKRSDGTAVGTQTISGEMKDDPSFGETEVYHAQAEAIVPAASIVGASDVVVTYQGCAEQGICYPPVTKKVDLTSFAITDAVHKAKSASSKQDIWTADPGLSRQTAKPAVERTQSNKTAGLDGNIGSVLVAFLGFGLLLSFTPCVFPMIPILSGMLAQSGEQLTARRGFVLSGAYVLAMALAYAALGVVVAWSGQNLQAALQTPLALGLMSAVFVGLALSMFGFYELQLPQAWQALILGRGNRRNGSIGGAAILGFGSALIVGPCVTPPLAAALVYVAQTGNVLRGAAALFSLGVGMGLPLLAFGTFGAGVLPKSGPWLVRVKQIFGFVFLGLAIWVLSRVLPWSVELLLWSAGLVIIAAYLAVPELLKQRGGEQWRPGLVAFGALPLAIGVLIATAAIASPDWLSRLAASPGISSMRSANAAVFETVSTSAELDNAIARARSLGKPVLVDFSAEWCVECKVMDRTVFSDATVLKRLRAFSLIRADATNYTEDTRAFMKRYDVVGPPTIIFLDAKTDEEGPDTRIIGPVNSKTFLEQLDRL